MQDLLVRCNAASDLTAALVRSPDRPVALHAAAALQALTDGHRGAQLALQECGGIQVSFFVCGTLPQSVHKPSCSQCRVVGWQRIHGP